MRFDADREVAKNHEGRSVATWKDGLHYFQQPVIPGDTNGPHEMALRPKGAPIGRGVLDSGSADGGANFWASRGAAWIKQLEQRNGPAGRLTSSEPWVPSNGRSGDVDHDETVLAISDDALTMFVDGRGIPRPDVQGETRLFDGLLAFAAGGRVQVYDVWEKRWLTVSQVGPGANKALAFRAGVAVWVLYQTDEHAGVVHPIEDASRGYQFGVPKQVYAPEVSFDATADAQLLIGWSIDEGEYRNLFREIPVLGAGMVTLDPIAPPMPVPVAPDVQSKVWVGAFRTTTETPGNLSLGPGINKAVICTLEELSEVDPQLVAGLFVAEMPNVGGGISLPDRIAQCRPVAEQMKVPMVVYWDGHTGDWDGIARLCGTTPWIPFVQLYVDCRGKEGETLDAFEARIRAEVQRVPKGWLGAVRMTHGSGAIAKEKVINAANRLVPLVNAPACLGWAAWAWDRADGIAKTPEFLPMAQAWMSGSPAGAPTDARKWGRSFYATKKTLAVVVSDWTREGEAPCDVSADFLVTGAAGAALTVSMTLNGRLVATTPQTTGRLKARVAEPGDYALVVTATIPTDSARTGQQRIVRVRRVAPPPPPPVPPPPPPLMDNSLSTLTNEAIASSVLIAYRTLLRREPDRSGYDSFTQRLRDGAVTVEGMENEIRASDEYKKLMDKPPLVVPVLSIVGKEFRNGSALYVPRWKSGLTLLVRSTAEQLAWLDWAVETGYNGFRVFAGALTWAGQEPQEARAALPGLLDRSAERGLAVEVTCLTDTATGYDCRAHVDELGAIMAGRRHVVGEIWNEYGHPSQRNDISIARSIEWGRELLTRRGILWAVGAASVDEPNEEGVYPTAGGDFCTSHLDRGRPAWDNVRRVREILAIVEAHNVPAINNEPKGADERDGRETGKQRWNDPALFFGLGVLDRGFTVGGVHHSQAGLMAALPGPVQQACASAYVAGHAIVESVLTGQRGLYKNVGHDDSPVTSTPVGEQDGAQMTRLYCFLAGSQGVAVELGIKAGVGTPDVRWSNGWQPQGVIASRTHADGTRIDVVKVAR